MYIILSKDVPGLGQKNRLMNVRNGYFVNYLQPKGLARVATVQLIEHLKEAILAQKQAAEFVLQGASEHAMALVKVVLKFLRKASIKGTLFKAIGEKDIVSAIKKEIGFEVSLKDVVMEHLKKVGEHEVRVKMGGKEVPVKVVVEAQGT